MKKFPKQDPGVLSRKLNASETALMRLDTDSVFWVIDGKAALIWDKLDGKTTVDELISNNILSNSMSDRGWRKNVNGLLEKLQTKKLITLVNESEREKGPARKNPRTKLKSPLRSRTKKS